MTMEENCTRCVHCKTYHYVWGIGIEDDIYRHCDFCEDLNDRDILKNYSCPNFLLTEKMFITMKKYDSGKDEKKETHKKGKDSKKDSKKR